MSTVLRVSGKQIARRAENHVRNNGPTGQKKREQSITVKIERRRKEALTGAQRMAHETFKHNRNDDALSSLLLSRCRFLSAVILCSSCSQNRRFDEKTEEVQKAFRHDRNDDTRRLRAAYSEEKQEEERTKGRERYYKKGTI